METSYYQNKTVSAASNFLSKVRLSTNHQLLKNQKKPKSINESLPLLLACIRFLLMNCQLNNQILYIISNFLASTISAKKISKISSFPLEKSQ
jgi:hypothetical protein